MAVFLMLLYSQNQYVVENKQPNNELIKKTILLRTCVRYTCHCIPGLTIPMRVQTGTSL